MSARCQAHREAQQRYRQTAKGREAHRLAERRRRMHRTKKTVDDQSSTPLPERPILPHQIYRGVVAFVGVAALSWRHFHGEAMPEDPMGGIDANEDKRRHEEDDPEESAQCTKSTQHFRQLRIH